MGNHNRLGAALAALLVFGSRAVHAATNAAPARFGNAGQWVIDQRFAVAAWHGRSLTFPETGDGIQLTPSAALFVLPRFSVGLGIPFGTDRTSVDNELTSRRTYLGISPRVGYALPLGKHFSLWPELGTTFTKTWLSMDGTPGHSQSTSTTVEVLAGLPLLWRPTDHFFVGVGPNYLWRFYAPAGQPLISAVRTLGLNSLIGGYFG